MKTHKKSMALCFMNFFTSLLNSLSTNMVAEDLKAVMQAKTLKIDGETVNFTSNPNAYDANITHPDKDNLKLTSVH